MVARALAVMLVLAGCGARTELAPTDDVPAAPDDVDLSPLGISAAFVVSQSTDGARPNAFASGVLWTGERRPMPGGSGGPGYRLGPGESLSVNGVPFMGGFADWGYTYQASVPPPPDGRWVFRFTLRGRTLVREVVLPPVRWVDFPTAPVSIARGVTLRWSPPLPDGAQRRAYLTSCVLNERTEVGAAMATFAGRLSAEPCLAHAQLSATLTVPLGAPFREGSSLSASTGLDREIRVVR